MIDVVDTGSETTRNKVDDIKRTTTDGRIVTGSRIERSTPSRPELGSGMPIVTSTFYDTKKQDEKERYEKLS